MRPFVRDSSGAGELIRLGVPHLHHDDAAFELSFGRAFEKLIDFFLNQLSDLLVSALPAYGAWDILDRNQIGLYCRSA